MASCLPESLTFLEAYRNDLIALGTVADIALAFLLYFLLVWALKREKYFLSIFLSVAFATYAGGHLWASYAFVTTAILN